MKDNFKFYYEVPHHHNIPDIPKEEVFNMIDVGLKDFFYTWLEECIESGECGEEYKQYLYKLENSIKEIINENKI